ncbi:ABC transporter ATP-binding protein [Fulvivirga sediminis]|uniref:ATP-binding cassette domain-containing protein n=1 Tax=Fulvivirga sediminis TaxID=2803949 RepID=A0A937F561_9BACT|nr:ATP-binding cassette domain-containing protein [Fulvivirga sediminis]MBL3654525.1 ATP-binding cassette domain-containing protein [Fulvivirga sediminis]
MIEVQHLSKFYNDQKVVDDVSFTVAQGEVLVLLGTSGSGKTTTLKMINQLVEKSSGSVLIHGKNTETYKAHELRRKIGYVIQSIGLFPHYTIHENIATVPELLNWPKHKINSRVKELLMLTGLPENMATKKPHELSGGQQQRVGIARALAADPDVILLDEPFGALDPITRSELQHEFKTLNSDLQKAMVLVTHDVLEAVILGDKIALMDQGKIQQIGTPSDLIFEPANDFVKKFLAQNRIQLELHVIRLNDLQKFTSLRLSTKEDALCTLAEYLSKNDDDEILKTYFNYRDKIISAYGKH